MTTADEDSRRQAVAFGLRWVSDVPLHQFLQTSGDTGPADITVARVEALVRPRRPLVTIDNATLCDDGVRYHAGGEASFDTLGGCAIEWTPGPAWSGEFPAVVFSTLTALLLAFRGSIPLHGTAVEIDGEAVLICGASGAGKSTLAAGLIALGARLISDDLSVIVPGDGTGAPVLYPGRPGMQLFPAAADMLVEAVGARVIRSGARGKQVVAPPWSPPLTAVPLTTVLVLGEVPGPVPAGRNAALLRAQLFRPRWMRSVPGSHARLAALHRAAGKIHMEALPLAGDSGHDRAGFIGRALVARAAIGRGAARRLNETPLHDIVPHGVDCYPAQQSGEP